MVATGGLINPDPNDNIETTNYSGQDRRRFESRRRCDVFPNGGAVAVTIAVFSAVAFLLGVGVGKWAL